MLLSPRCVAWGEKAGALTGCANTSAHAGEMGTFVGRTVVAWLGARACAFWRVQSSSWQQEGAYPVVACGACGAV